MDTRTKGRETVDYLEALGKIDVDRVERDAREECCSVFHLSIKAGRESVVGEAKRCFVSTYSIAQAMTLLLNSLDGQTGSIRVLGPFQVNLTSQ